MAELQQKWEKLTANSTTLKKYNHQYEIWIYKICSNDETVIVIYFLKRIILIYLLRFSADFALVGILGNEQ